MSNITKKEKRLSFSIPTRSIWSVLMLTILVWFTYIQTVWYFIPSFKILWKLQISDIAMIHLPLFWAPLILCLLIFSIFLLFIRIFKSLKTLKGWNNGLFTMVTIFFKATFVLFVISFVLAYDKDEELRTLPVFIFLLLFSLILGCVSGTIRELHPEKQQEC